MTPPVYFGVFLRIFFIFQFLRLSLTSMTGVARVVAIVSGDPQDPVLDVVQPVGCDFGAALREDGAPASARCRLAR